MTTTTTPQLAVTRIFDAPRALVYQAFTDRPPGGVVGPDRRRNPSRRLLGGAGHWKSFRSHVIDAVAGGSGAAALCSGVPDVLLDEVVVDCDGGSGSFACGGDDLGARVAGVAGHPDAGDTGSAGGVDPDEPSFVDLAAQRVDQVVVVRVE